jgi:hypothetical protein
VPPVADSCCERLCPRATPGNVVVRTVSVEEVGVTVKENAWVSVRAVPDVESVTLMLKL